MLVVCSSKRFSSPVPPAPLCLTLSPPLGLQQQLRMSKHPHPMWSTTTSASRKRCGFFSTPPISTSRSCNTFLITPLHDRNLLMLASNEQKFPWGDGKKSLFYNAHMQGTPEEREQSHHDHSTQQVLHNSLRARLCVCTSLPSSFLFLCHFQLIPRPSRAHNNHCITSPHTRTHIHTHTLTHTQSLTITHSHTQSLMIRRKRKAW